MPTLAVQDVGAGTVPEVPALKPNDVPVPAASDPFQAAFVAETLPALELLTAFHMFVTVTGQAYDTDQPEIACVPVLRTWTSAVRPVPQSLTVRTLTWRARGAVVAVVVGLGVAVAVAVAVGFGVVVVAVAVGFGVVVAVAVAVGLGVVVAVGFGVVVAVVVGLGVVVAVGLGVAVGVGVAVARVAQ